MKFKLMLATAVAAFIHNFAFAADLPGTRAGIARDGDVPSYLDKCNAVVDVAQIMLDGLEKCEGASTVSNLLEPLDELYLHLGAGFGKAGLYAQVYPAPEMRQAAQECEQKLVKVSAKIGLSRPLYERISAVDLSAADDDTRYFHFKELRDFRRAGVDKDEATRDRIRALNEEINEIGQVFARNVREDVRHVDLDPGDLAGLPEDYIATHPPMENGKVRITTNYPDAFPFFSYADSDQARYDLSWQFANRGYPANQEVLKNLLVKRYELAGILGYPNYANYVTETKMIETPDQAQSFIDEVSDLAGGVAKREYDALLTQLRKKDPKAEKVNSWQRSYLMEQIKREQFQVDSKEIRQYLSYDRVEAGVFKLASDLFGVTFKPWDTPVWHESVKAFEMWDGDQLIGRFYLDMHPRDGKYKHGAMFPIQAGVEGGQRPVVSLVVNLPGGDDGPGLMQHGDVRTFFHEFGHLLHYMFGGSQRWSGLNSSGLEWDFIEAPSQMLEEWMWDAETLQQFAVNEAGEVMPADLIDRMVAARYVGTGLFTRGQMYLAALALNYYNKNPARVDLLPVMMELYRKYRLFDYMDGTHSYANFGHLDGYSAIYYTYMWSQTIANDLFGRFEAAGIRNTDMAREYRDKVLAVGSTRPAAESVADFLGRPHNMAAFAERMELSPLGK